MNRRLTVTVVDSAHLCEEDILTMWSIRLAHMELKPGFGVDEDLELFEAKVRRSCCALLLRDARGLLRGFFVVIPETVIHEGRAVRCLNPEYLYVERDHRGGSEFFFGAVAMGLRLLATERAEYVIGLTYPSSFLAFSEGSRSRVALGQPGLGSADDALLRSVGRHLGGEAFCESRALIAPTLIPKDLRRRVPTCPRRQETLALYERLNPNWREGWCVVVMAPMNLETILHAAFASVMRCTQRFRRAPRRSAKVDEVNSRSIPSASPRPPPPFVTARSGGTLAPPPTPERPPCSASRSFIPSPKSSSPSPW